MIELVYLTQDNCGMCEYFKPTFNRMCTEQGWSHREVNAKTIMSTVLNLRIQKTPAILIYYNSEYKGKIEGVHRRETIVERVKELTG